MLEVCMQGNLPKGCQVPVVSHATPSPLPTVTEEPQYVAKRWEQSSSGDTIIIHAAKAAIPENFV